MGIIDGFYFSTRYPGDDSIEINEEDLRHCEKAISGCRDFTMEYVKKKEKERTIHESRSKRDSRQQR